MYYQNEVDPAEKKQRSRVIAVATSLAVVIVLLVVAIIVTATNKTSSEEEVVGAETELETNDSPIAKQEDHSDDKNKAASAPAKTEEKASKAVAKVETVSKLPTTGPVDMLPIALVLGMLTTGATYFAMAKRER